MFTPHPNLADDVNHAIIQSEIEGGVFLHDLPPSTILHIQTMHHCYTAVLLGGSDATSLPCYASLTRYNDPEFVEMERQEDLRRSAADLLLVERAKEWLLEESN